MFLGTWTLLSQGERQFALARQPFPKCYSLLGWGELTSIFNPICSSSQHATAPTPAPPQHQEGRNPRTFEEADKYEQRKIIFLTLTILPVCTEHLGGGRGCAFRPLGWCSLTAGSERNIVKASNSELPPFLKYTGLAGGEKDFP